VGVLRPCPVLGHLDADSLRLGVGLRSCYGFMRPFSYGCMLSMRGDFVLGLLFCLVAGPAPAEPVAWTWSGRMSPPPPAEYAHPYQGKLTVYRVPLAEMGEHCRNVPRALGCAYWDRHALAYCTVYVPNDLPAKAEAAILAHELGHCNGWIHHNNEGKDRSARDPVSEDRLFDDKASQAAAEAELREAARRRARSNAVCQTEPKPEACP
jgi:hypothetical protein